MTPITPDILAQAVSEAMETMAFMSPFPPDDPAAAPTGPSSDPAAAPEATPAASPRPAVVVLEEDWACFDFAIARPREVK